MFGKLMPKKLLVTLVLVLVLGCVVLILQQAGILAKISLNFGFVSVDLSPKVSDQSDRPSVTTNSNPKSTGTLPQQNETSMTTNCPYDPLGVYLPNANTWYGPIGNTDYYLGYNYGFWTWSAGNGYLSFPDPNGQIQRNLWLNLISTPLAVCVDDTNHVFVKQIQ